MKVIAFTGMPASGKSFASEYLKKDFPVVRMGDLVWEETEKRGLDLTGENVGKVADGERKDHHFGIWAERTVERINRDHAERNAVIIDGLRGKAELEVFEDKLGADFILVAIHASPQTRYERLMGRNRVDDDLNWDAFAARDDRELSWGLGDTIALAEIMFVNEGEQRDLEHALEQLMAYVQLSEED